MGSAVFVDSMGAPAGATIHRSLEALKTITVGDMLNVGEGYRADIRERTFAGVDVDGAAFAPYSERGPYYFYANKDAASGRTAAGRQARATASGNRFRKTGSIGVRGHAPSIAATARSWPNGRAAAGRWPITPRPPPARSWPARSAEMRPVTRAPAAPKTGPVRVRPI
jgi:hypothetical protein